MESDATTPCPMRVNQRRNISLHFRMVERLHNETALPGLVGTRIPCLHGAAAANGEMLAERRDTIRRSRGHFHKACTLAINFGEDGFAR